MRPGALLSITRSVFDQNSATLGGAAVFINGGVVTNSLFARNTTIASPTLGNGAAIHLNTSVAYVTNTIVGVMGDGVVGASSTSPTTTHTYGAVGNYTARVTATNGISTLVATTAVTITEAPIVGLGIVSHTLRVR